jgi:hypothetical protein
VDMKPIMPELNETQESNQKDEFDFSEISDEVLDGLIAGLDKYVETPTVVTERKKFLVEKARRKSNAQTSQSQEEPQAEAAQETTEASGETSDASSPADSTMGSEVHSEASGGSGSTGDGAKEDQSETEDAGAFARDKVTEENGEGDNPPAKSPEEDAELAQLQGQLDFSILKAHGVSLENIGKLSKIQMEYMIANPVGSGVASKKEEEKEKDVDLVPSNTEKSVSMVQEAPVKQVQITKELLGPEVVEENSSGPVSVGITQDREQLESQLTGPILRAYGRNRKEVPSIGDNELALMIENPTAKIAEAQLEQARASDSLSDDAKKEFKVETVAAKLDNGELATPDGIRDNESRVNLKGFKELDPDKLKKFESSLKSGALLVAEVKEEREESKVNLEGFKEIEDGGEKLDTSLETNIEELTKDLSDGEKREVLLNLPNMQSRKKRKEEIRESRISEDSDSDAMDIISREHMPIPADVDDIPPFPQDVSKVSDGELFSLHAVYYSCEARANWLLSQNEDELGDIEKLKRHREAVVANSVPFMGEDGKRNTNEFRDTKVNSDSEVLKLSLKEHEINKIVKKLKVLRDNYRTSVAVCSRQYSMRSGELSGGIK